MRVRRSDFRKVRATADEIADHVKRNDGRTPATERAVCVNCGTRIWYSGMAIGSHVRGCPRTVTAPAAVLDFYRRYHDETIEAQEIAISQAFRPGDGWVDTYRGIAATKPNLALLKRAGYTSVAFDLIDESSPLGFAHYVADFRMAQVA